MNLIYIDLLELLPQLTDETGTSITPTEDMFKNVKYQQFTWKALYGGTDWMPVLEHLTAKPYMKAVMLDHGIDSTQTVPTITG